MKTITISDKDYNDLMEFSKELQTQANHSQAFPYYWEPASEKLVNDPNNEGEVTEIFIEDDNETISPKGFAENSPDTYRAFLEEIEDEFNPDFKYQEDLERDWVEYIENYVDNARTYSSNWEQSSDHNPSLFLSDVKNYIKSNKHHLGRNPRTYANTVHRMYKMEKLIEIIYRINPQPKEDVNDEAIRFVFKK